MDAACPGGRPGIATITSHVAVTVWTRPGDILYGLKAVDLVSAGDVLVVDGAVRDLDGLDAAGLPTFAATGIDDLLSTLRPPADGC